MLPRSLQWRISLAYTAFIFITMGAVSLYLVSFVRGSYISNLKVKVEQQAHLVGETTAPYLEGPLDASALISATGEIGDLIDAQVTIFGPDSTVLADNSEGAGDTESQLGRPEVGDAIALGLGHDTRVDPESGRELLYAAVPIEIDGALVGVARVAVPTSQVQGNVNRIVLTVVVSALIVAFLSLALGFLVLHRTSRSLLRVSEGARRLAEGDLDHRVEALSSDESQEVATSFNTMATTLRDIIRDLSAERNKLSAVLDTMADGVLVSGSEGRITLLNQAAESLLNVRMEQAIGGRLVEVLRDHELLRLVSRAESTGQLQYGEMELLHHRRLLGAIATPLTENGSRGVLLTLHDLTRVRHVETMRKEFVSNVSHELRSPLASIKALAETLEDGALEDRPVARDFVRRIRWEVGRMNGIVGDLLGLSRLESGQAPLNLRPLYLCSAIEEVSSQLRGRAEAKGLTLDVALPHGLTMVVAEEEKLCQVLVNLLVNAIKFTPPGGEVAVSTGEDKNFVEVRVRDTGIGISQEDLPHVFERFYKVDRARGDDGIGLGLAIVKHIVQAHGGQVKVESTEGAGSTFAFTVPKAR